MVDPVQPTLSLRSDRMHIVGTPSAQPGQLQFDLWVDGKSLGNIGSQGAAAFRRDLLDVLSTRSGTRIRSVANAVFSAAVGEDAEYLGYVELSGLNTFFFFRNGPSSLHVVLADTRGKMIAHAPLDAAVADDWRRQMRKL